LEDRLSHSKIGNGYEDIIEHLEKIQAPLAYSWGVVGHLMGVKNSKELREAHDAIQPSVIEIYQKIGQSQALFNSLKHLKENEEIWNKYDNVQQRIVVSAIKQMESSGVGLDDSKREKFNKLQLEAAELSTKFSNNVLDSTKKFKLKLTNKNDIIGLPDSAKSFAAQQAVVAGDTQATAEDGPWIISLDLPSYLPVMQHLKNRKIRETLYKAYVTRASTDAHDNAPIIKRILQIKTEMAKMLGYKSIAEKSLSVKMAPSVDAVLQLTTMLREKAMPAALKELEELKVFAKKNGFEEDTIALWDLPYWSERLREAQYQFQEEELRAYFPLPKVLEGLFSLANRLFGVVVVPAAEGEVQVWNEDVKFYHVNDEATGARIASFYLDPYSRPAEKKGGAWMDVCLGKSKVLDRKPVAYLVCNGSPPVGGEPSLMTFRLVFFYYCCFIPMIIYLFFIILLL
jgi:oligopeptidase A